jgi:hypothetical protein
MFRKIYDMFLKIYGMFLKIYDVILKMYDLIIFTNAHYEQIISNPQTVLPSLLLWKRFPSM